MLCYSHGWGPKEAKTHLVITYSHTHTHIHTYILTHMNTCTVRTPTYSLGVSGPLGCRSLVCTHWHVLDPIMWVCAQFDWKPLELADRISQSIFKLCGFLIKLLKYMLCPWPLLCFKCSVCHKKFINKIESSFLIVCGGKIHCWTTYLTRFFSWDNNWSDLSGTYQRSINEWIKSSAICSFIGN